MNQGRLVKHISDYSRVSGEIFVKDEMPHKFLSHVVAKYFGYLRFRCYAP